MSDLLNYKVGNASKRISKTLDMMEKFNYGEIFAKWGLVLDCQPATVHGKLLAFP